MLIVVIIGMVLGAEVVTPSLTALGIYETANFAPKPFGPRGLFPFHILIHFFVFLASHDGLQLTGAFNNKN